MRAAAIIVPIAIAAGACAAEPAPPPAVAPAPSLPAPKRALPPWPTFEPASVPPPPEEEPASTTPEPGDHPTVEAPPSVRNAARTVAGMAPSFRRDLEAGSSQLVDQRCLGAAVFRLALEALLFLPCTLRHELRVGAQPRHQLCGGDLLLRHGMSCGFSSTTTGA
jgi:hypothetical protein